MKLPGFKAGHKVNLEQWQVDYYPLGKHCLQRTIIIQTCDIKFWCPKLWYFSQMNLDKIHEYHKQSHDFAMLIGKIVISIVKKMYFTSGG